MSLLSSRLRGLAMKIFCVFFEVGSTGLLEPVDLQVVILDSVGGLVPKP